MSGTPVWVEEPMSVWREKQSGWGRCSFGSTILRRYWLGTGWVDARTKYESYLEHKFPMLPRMNGYKLKAYLLFIYCAWGCGCKYAPMTWHVYRGQRATLRSQFSPSNMWVLGTELKLDLVANVFLYPLSHELFWETFHLIFSDQSWLWVTETRESKLQLRGAWHLENTRNWC